MQPIDWLVLRREEDRALLIADRVLERLPYHRSRSAVLWADCDLRSWLNGIFLHTAFLAEEQALLLTTDLSDGPNPVFQTRNGSQTQNNVFLLSPEEWTRYHNLFTGEIAKTPWAAREGGAVHGSCPVWMRLPGLSTQYAVVLDLARQPNYQGRLVNDNTVGALPALWVRV